MDNSIMFKLTYGLFVLTAKDGAKANGCIINTAMQQTSTPNVISITVNKQNFTEQMVRKTGKFNISFLDESVTFDTFKHFGFQSGRDTDKFANWADCAVAANGIPYITKGANAYLSCEVKEFFDLGTHTLFLASVVDGETLSSVPSVTYTYYQANVKPKPGAGSSSGAAATGSGVAPSGAAPSGAAADAASEAPAAPKAKVWVCRICGYVYDEAEEKIPFEDLPADWTCPWCKHGKQDFELQE